MLTNFSRRDRIMVFLLILLLIGLAYYRFIHISVGQAYDSAKNEASQLQTEVDIANARLISINKMKDEMKAPSLSRMGSYNNSKPETAFLHTALSSVPNYSLTFSEVTRDGNQIRRGFNLRFTASSYTEAVNVVRNLTEGEFRCLLGDMSCNIDDNGQTTVTLNGTFYETMVGGTEDSALPADSSDNQSDDPRKTGEVSDLLY